MKSRVGSNKKTVKAKADRSKKAPVKESKKSTPVVKGELVDETALDSAPIRPEIIDENEVSELSHIDEADTDESQLPIIVEKADTRSVATLDPLALYLREIQKYPVLSREKEREVATKYYETKDPAAAELLVKSNLRFVVKVAAEYAKFSAKMIDLIQEGNVGLMHAVKEYNPYKGNRLITYAVWWIRGYIQEYLMRQFSLVRIGTTANQRKLFYQLRKQREELEKMSSPDRIKALSRQLDIPEDEIAEMTQRMTFRDVSLDKPVDNDDDSVSLGSLLKRSDGSEPIDEQLALAEQIEILKEAIEKIRPQLSEKEKIILEERVLNEEPLTLQEIGEKYKITREAVRQNEVRLINKIKTALGLQLP